MHMCSVCVTCVTRNPQWSPSQKRQQRLSLVPQPSQNWSFFLITPFRVLGSAWGEHLLNKLICCPMRKGNARMFNNRFLCVIFTFNFLFELAFFSFFRAVFFLRYFVAIHLFWHTLTPWSIQRTFDVWPITSSVTAFGHIPYIHIFAVSAPESKLISRAHKREKCSYCFKYLSLILHTHIHLDPYFFFVVFLLARNLIPFAPKLSFAEYYGHS